MPKNIYLQNKGVWVIKSLGFFGHCFRIIVELTKNVQRKNKKAWVTKSFGFFGHCFLIEFELPKKVQGRNKKVWVTESFSVFGHSYQSQNLFLTLKNITWSFSHLVFLVTASE